ncbi:MAG: hypothetical protein IT158_12215 [Bryobacterales bacterium]|nr:hypothetical protein [Bryobacterales bacterium]
MLRRDWLALALMGVPLRAADRAVLDLLGEMATALSGGDAHDFLAGFDSSMPGYGQLEANVIALTQQNEILASIVLTNEQSEGADLVVELDWMLEIRSRQPAGPLVRRRETVTCRLAKRKKRWRVTALSPLGFFSAPLH